MGSNGARYLTRSLVVTETAVALQRVAEAFSEISVTKSGDHLVEALSTSVGRKSLGAAPAGAAELVPRPRCSLGL
jgi:hypothetical protein